MKKDFERLQKICLEEVISAGITPGNIVKWSINTRAKTRWGMCTKHRNGDCEIQIAARLLEDDAISEMACKTTIVHEILHTCKDCDGHTGKWLLYANMMNRKYGYHIKRSTSSAEKGVEEQTPVRREAKYVFVCKTCGQVIVKTRACPFTKSYQNYICGICGTKRAFVLKTDSVRTDGTALS